MSAAVASSSGRLSSRWRTFKFRRRLLQLPRRSEGFKLLFSALPRFVKFLVRVTLSSFKRNKHLVKIFFHRKPAAIRKEKKERKCNSSIANSDESQVCTSNFDVQLAAPKKASSLHDIVFPSSLRNLSSQELAQVILVAKENNWDKVLLLPNNEGVQGQDLFKLLQGQWLNSDIVNTYFSLLKLRCDRPRNCLQTGCGNLKFDPTSSGHHPSCLNAHFFTSFWYTKYIKSGYYGVRRWTRDIDVRTYDCLFFPVNLNNLHWVLVVVYIASGVVEFYDSLSSTSFKSVTTTVIKYMDEEALENNWSSSNFKNWKPVDVGNAIPRQVDSNNCGVYMCVYADLLSRGLRPPFSFSSKDISSIRLGMAADFLKGFVC
ncbi:hypothetical protein O6H91_03G013800 [Diphasiastrum complanatum]|uniref:Uncharacterized protein n=1 Tax=Diphasiastrum complanatum TaxID=34168 RepID=A0ACC2E3Z0_DIPCM|nr:hypothetical protein O6H91_03G013800 [Diphasiastrum complanatum]